MNILAQIRYLIRVMENWPVVVVDKAGIRASVDYRTRNGITVRCRSRTSDVPEAVLVLGELEYPRELLRVSEGATIIDVGANIGTFALLASHVNPQLQFHGYALEPYAPSASLARDNLATNGYTMFEVIELAIANFDGRAFLRTDRQPDAMHLDDSGEPVLACKLSSFCGSRDIRRIDLLKVDIEGAEYDVFDEDAAFISATARNVLVEWHNLDESRSRRRLEAALREGFVTSVVTDRGGSGLLHAQNRLLA